LVACNFFRLRRGPSCRTGAAVWAQARSTRVIWEAGLAGRARDPRRAGGATSRSHISSPTCRRTSSGRSAGCLGRRPRRPLYRWSQALLYSHPYSQADRRAAPEIGAGRRAEQVSDDARRLPTARAIFARRGRSRATRGPQRAAAIGQPMPLGASTTRAPSRSADDLVRLPN
jgi:hypothetical protein